MTDGTGFFEIVSTTRAMRRLKPDPIPDDLLRQVLQAGAYAANSSNAQAWRFLVVRDPAIKSAVQVWYQRAFEERVAAHYLEGDPPPGVTREKYRRQYEAVNYLTEHFHEAPVWIVPCLETGGVPPNHWSGASIYPAVQNMLLAARALGLGATMTTRHLIYGAESEAALGLPEGVRSFAIIPLGYPMGNFGPVSRRPLEEIVFSDRWGQPLSGLG